MCNKNEARNTKTIKMEQNNFKTHGEDNCVCSLKYEEKAVLPKSVNVKLKDFKCKSLAAKFQVVVRGCKRLEQTCHALGLTTEADVTLTPADMDKDVQLHLDILSYDSNGKVNVEITSGKHFFAILPDCILMI